MYIWIYKSREKAERDVYGRYFNDDAHRWRSKGRKINVNISRTRISNFYVWDCGYIYQRSNADSAFQIFSIEITFSHEFRLMSDEKSWLLDELAKKKILFWNKFLLFGHKWNRWIDKNRWFLLTETCAIEMQNILDVFVWSSTNMSWTGEKNWWWWSSPSRILKKSTGRDVGTNFYIQITMDFHSARNSKQKVILQFFHRTNTRRIIDW